MEKKTGSLLELIRVPSVIMISLVIVVISNTWGFLDPTLEPHLREVRKCLMKVTLTTSKPKVECNVSHMHAHTYCHNLLLVCYSHFYAVMKILMLIIAYYCVNIDSFLLFMTTLMDISKLSSDDVSLLGKNANPHKEKHRNCIRHL
jgi:hypothetical protein